MNKLSQVRFKYLLGEFHLASWKPRLQVVQQGDDSEDRVIGAADLAPAELAAAAEGLWVQGRAVGAFDLGVSRSGQWLCYVPRIEKLHYVRVTGGFDTYLNRWNSKARYNLKRSVRKLLDRNPGGVLEIAAAPDLMEGFLREAAAISQTTYQSRLLQSGLQYDEILVEQMRTLASRGEARGYLLRDQGRAIAFAWCSGSGLRLTYDVVGYLEDAAPLSPGSVLLYLIIEDLFRLGRFQVFDFGVGDAPYKQMFATDMDEFADAYLFRPTWRSRLLVYGHWLLDRFSSAIGLLLEKAGLKARVRRLLRAVGSA